jgi:hypothetical protein
MTRVPPPTSHGAVDDEIAGLAALSLEELRARWLSLKGVAMPKFMRRGLMTLAVAHAVREATDGGLDAATRKRLDALVAGIVPAGGKPPPRPIRIKPGTRLLREWQGKVHEVAVADDGFLWNGQTHRSLSHIARLITGTRWNGWVFFGLKGRTSAEGAGRGASAGVSSGTSDRARMGALADCPPGPSTSKRRRRSDAERPMAARARRMTRSCSPSQPEARSDDG